MAASGLVCNLAEGELVEAKLQPYVIASKVVFKLPLYFTISDTPLSSK